jgi:transcription elongation factor GreA
MGEKLTQADIDKIQEEIDYRKLTLRPELLSKVKEARAQGDLSENFEYHAAKSEKNQNDSRIRYLERMLKNADVISDHFADDQAGINRRVEIKFEDDNETQTFKLVTPIRGQSLEGRISIESPLGKALLGKKPGEKAQVMTPDGGSYYVDIISVALDETDDDIRSF